MRVIAEAIFLDIPIVVMTPKRELVMSARISANLKPDWKLNYDVYKGPGVGGARINHPLEGKTYFNIRKDRPAVPEY